MPELLRRSAPLLPGEAVLEMRKCNILPLFVLTSFYGQNTACNTDMNQHILILPYRLSLLVYYKVFKFSSVKSI